MTRKKINKQGYTIAKEIRKKNEDEND